jgi:hypothetical protein
MMWQKRVIEQSLHSQHYGVLQPKQKTKGTLVDATAFYERCFTGIHQLGK